MKTVSFDDDAYNLLKGAKLSPDESFSDVVKRSFGVRRPLADSAGGWSDVREGDVKRMRRDAIGAFGTTKE